MPTRLKAGFVISINRSEYRDRSVAEVFGLHYAERAWWSSSKRAEVFKGMPAFVRFAGTNEIVGRAVFREDVPADAPWPGEETLRWKYEVDFHGPTPIRGLFLRDFITGGRARQALIGLSSAERDQLDEALTAAGCPALPGTTPRLTP
jgi:hypothetical protein